MEDNVISLFDSMPPENCEFPTELEVYLRKLAAKLGLPTGEALAEAIGFTSVIVGILNEGGHILVLDKHGVATVGIHDNRLDVKSGESE